MSQRELAELLRERGHDVKTGATIGGWERGQWQPRNARLVADLEHLLHAEPGQLAALAGYSSETDMGARLRLLEEWRERAQVDLREQDRHHLDVLSREFAAFRDDVNRRLDEIEDQLFGPTIHAQAAHGGKAGEVRERRGPGRGTVLGSFDPDEEGSGG